MHQQFEAEVEALGEEDEVQHEALEAEALQAQAVDLVQEQVVWLQAVVTMMSLLCLGAPWDLRAQRQDQIQVLCWSVG